MDRDTSARNPEAAADDLTTVFARIQGMLLSVQDASAAVEQLAEVALGFVHSAVGAGASLMDEAGHRTSTATTDRIAAAADALQYELGEGPCVSAWAATAVQRVDDTGTESRWAQWCAAAAGLGIRSALSAPMVFRGKAIGALKVYSTSIDRFTAEDEQRLVLLAGAAATLLGIAQDPEAPRRLSAGLQAALADRKAVETATGMLMERHGLGHDAARSRLMSASRSQRRPVAEIARGLVARAADPAM